MFCRVIWEEEVSMTNAEALLVEYIENQIWGGFGRGETVKGLHSKAAL